MRDLPRTGDPQVMLSGLSVLHSQDGWMVGMDLGWMDGWRMDGWMDGSEMDGWMVGWMMMDGWIWDEWMDGWI